MADVLDDAAIQAEPQYYLMSLPEAPVAEIAEAVLGEALGLPFRVDPAVDATLSFQVDGLYSPRALARELGYRLWNADVALIEKPSSGLWLIPKARLETAMADGAVLVSPPVGISTGRAPPAPVVPTPVNKPPAQASSTDWAWLAWLATGWAGGAASILAWIRLRRRPAPAVALLSAPASPPPAPAREADASDDLIIPNFHRPPSG